MDQTAPSATIRLDGAWRQVKVGELAYQRYADGRTSLLVAVDVRNGNEVRFRSLPDQDSIPLPHVKRLGTSYIAFDEQRKLRQRYAPAIQVALSIYEIDRRLEIAQKARRRANVMLAGVICFTALAIATLMYSIMMLVSHFPF